MSRSFGGMSKFGGGSGFPQQQQQYGGGDSYEPSDLGGGDGGGFQGTQGEGDTPRSAKRSGAIVQTLTPVTVRQLHLATHTHPDDIFKVDDRELNQITLVGQIVNLQVQSTNVELEVDDGTGKIGVRMWLDVEEENQSSRKWDVGSYVRVIGNLRSFMDTRSVLAFRVMPIEMYDEVTYHFLDVIHVHLAVTKGELDATDSSSAASGGRGTSGYGGAQRGGGGGGGGGMRMQQQHQQAPMHHQGMGMGGRPGGLLDRPPHQGQSSPYGHQTAPPPSQSAYPSTQPPSGGVYQQSGGYYQDPYQMNTGGYYGSQWSHQQPAAPAHQAQSVYGYPAATQQSGYGSYAGYQQPVAQQQAYSYPQQQQAWPQQQLQQPPQQQQQMQQQQMQQQQQIQIQQQSYGSYGM